MFENVFSHSSSVFVAYLYGGRITYTQYIVVMWVLLMSHKQRHFILVVNVVINKWFLDNFNWMPHPG